ncbi:hypothetical protein SNE40_002207 [Patella caerulea]|uniref:protein-tyrosine-phosphatase n=1 Tax=Patella caerulea TaxID=87958 RepID=A0AAN8K5D1_PATCE
MRCAWLNMVEMLTNKRFMACCHFLLTISCYSFFLGNRIDAKAANLVYSLQHNDKTPVNDVLTSHVISKRFHDGFYREKRQLGLEDHVTHVNAGDRKTEEEIKLRKKRGLPQEELTTTIPPEYVVVVTLGAGVNNPNRTIDSAIQSLRDSFSKVLNRTLDKIRVDRISLAGNVVGLYFLRHAPIDDDILLASDLIPAKDILVPGLVSKLQKKLPDLNITAISLDHQISLANYETPFWTKPFFPYVTAALCMAVITLVTVIVYVCCCIKNKKAKFEEPLSHLEIFYPTIKPDVKDPLGIQPEGCPVYLPKGSITPQPTQPVLVKKKLLERRGSNASLTIDLNPSPELTRWDGTPPKESSGIEFLMSAGNRLSRRDLRNSLNNTRDIYEEFWEIPMNHTEKVSVAGSGMKNRYKTIIPNEHTRVILADGDGDGDPLSSYINANYIRGYEAESRAYIATQGPMAHTIVDFWKMVWFERCPIIVMITKLKEKSKPKCENYLPDTTAMFGDIEVTVDRVINRNGFEVRHLTLRCGGEHLTVLHYWYQTWPDQRPSESPKMLLQLIKEVELRRYKPESMLPRGPVIVHCSAGIGRTGCFIAVSVGMKQLREEHSVDILGIVCSMRLDRGGMIQTHEQYEFIHQALCTYEQELSDPNMAE